LARGVLAVGREVAAARVGLGMGPRFDADNGAPPPPYLPLGLGHREEWSGEDARGRADAGQDMAGARTRCGSGGVTRAG
jgi:hypothetical protein